MCVRVGKTRGAPDGNLAGETCLLAVCCTLCSALAEPASPRRLWAACPSFSHYFRGLQGQLSGINHRYFAKSKCVLQRKVLKKPFLWMQQEGASSCDAGGEPCFGVGELCVLLGFLKKSPHKNRGALRGELYIWTGVTAASVAWPASPLVLELCVVDR